MGDNIKGDKMKTKRFSQQKYAFFAALSCVLIYFSLAALFLKTEEKVASKTETQVPKENLTGELLVYCECEELNEYSAVYIDFDMKTITVFLFPDKETAKTYGLAYNRHIKYSKQLEIEFIGRIGGIVIDTNYCYNISDGKKERVFGNRVIELSTENAQAREHISYSFLYALLSARVGKTDFLYVAENCETDISYADFYEYFDVISEFKDKISVRVIL